MPATLEDATERFYSALNAVLGGDAAAMLDVWSHADDVSYMSPFGELLAGWEPVRGSWEAQAAQRLGGSVAPEELRHYASPELGAVVGFERGSVEIDGVSTPVDSWAMIGHHTDPLG
jgi:ketosteroid isomerase-like protein